MVVFGSSSNPIIRKPQGNPKTLQLGAAYVVNTMDYYSRSRRSGRLDLLAFENGESRATSLGDFPGGVRP